MSIHDWIRVDSGTFHDFHQTWTLTLCNALNAGILPTGYFAMLEQRQRPAQPVADLLAGELASLANTVAEDAGGLAIATALPRAQLTRRADAEVYAGRANQPNVSVVHSERLAGFDPHTGLIPFAPDLAVEVISPNDTAYAVGEEIEEYLANGFALIWIVQPNTKTVTIYRGDGSVAMLHERDEITGERALPTFRCKVSEFFAG